MFNSKIIEDIENKIGYTFKDKGLLEQCFTHSSFVKHDSKTFVDDDNERLEFFGDAILQFLVSEYLFKKSKDDEGKMTERRQRLVAAEPLEMVINNLDIKRYILSSGNDKDNLGKKAISSLFEALVSGIYLDGGIEEARAFAYRSMKDIEKQTEENSKSALQEMVQNEFNTELKYTVISKDGPDHAPIYTVKVEVGDKFGIGQGASKKKAEQAAAKDVLSKLGGR